MDPIQRLLQRAHEHVPGLEANAALWEIRERAEAEHGRVSVYELVVTGERPWKEILGVVLPRLVRLLDAREIVFPGAPHLIVPLWIGDEAHVFDAPLLFEAVAEIEGIGLEALEHRLRTANLPAAVAPVLALVPSRSSDD